LCNARQQTTRIPIGTSLDDALNVIELPPYHPGCDCRFRIDFDAPSGYLTRETLWDVLDTLEGIYERYLDSNRPWFIDNPAISLKRMRDLKDDEPIIQSVRRGIGKSCYTRARELMALFANYLLASGIKGCEVSMESVPIHAWVVFRYTYVDERGVVQRGTERYDAWIALTRQQFLNYGKEMLGK
jgi:hypothetical protein